MLGDILHAEFSNVHEKISSLEKELAKTKSILESLTAEAAEIVTNETWYLACDHYEGVIAFLKDRPTWDPYTKHWLKAEPTTFEILKTEEGFPPVLKDEPIKPGECRAYTLRHKKQFLPHLVKSWTINNVSPPGLLVDYHSVDQEYAWSCRVGGEHDKCYDSFIIFAKSWLDVAMKLKGVNDSTVGFVQILRTNK